MHVGSNTVADEYGMNRWQQVSKEKKGKIVDARCRDLTSAFACEKGRADPGSVELCSFHEVSLTSSAP